MYPGTFAASSPDKAAIVMIDTGETVSYRELEDRSLRLANHLTGQGLKVGDGFVMIAENSPRQHEAYWAALRSGLYLTLLNHHLSIDELVYIVRDSGAAGIITSAEYENVARKIVEAVPELRVRIGIGTHGDLFSDYETVLTESSSVVPESQPCGRDMLYSSGTTGRAKAVRAPLPDRQVDEAGDPLLDAFGPLYQIDDTAIYLSPAPLYHAAPLRFGGLLHAVGGTLLIMSKFDPVRCLEVIDEFQVTHSQWVPTMFVRMLKLPYHERKRFTLASLRYAIHAAAPCPAEVKRRMLEWWGPIVYEYYTSTEVVGITEIGPEEWEAHEGSVGRAILGIPHICDDTLEGHPEVTPGTDGLIYFERDAMPFEYLHDPEKTESARHPVHRNWATVGDLGHLDEEGFLYLTDRKAFTIISGGVNIYPQEIEDVLSLHPKVGDVAVIGIPNPDFGQEVKAVIQLAPGVEPRAGLEAELIDYVKERIARFKAPKSIDFVEVLPRTPVGKLMKKDLIAAYSQ